MSDDTTPPIEVHATPWEDQAWAAIRQLAPPVMAFLIGRHLIADDTAVLFGVAGGVIYPIILGQLKTRERSKQLTAVANAVPDAIAKVTLS